MAKAEIELIFNKGLHVLNMPETVSEEKTIIVIGAARGGTSMVAGVLHNLGVCMGEKVSAVYEDLALSEAVEAKDSSAIERIIAEKNKKYPVWGWKRPASIKYLPLWKDKFRNPMYIIVFRDIFAIANRNRISMMSEVVRNMQDSLQHFGQILDFIKDNPSPIMLISYEKAMLFKDFFVNTLCDFIGLRETGNVAAALASIQLNPEEYLKGSRITQSIGSLAELRSNKIISGWAMFKNPANINIPLVTLTINGKHKLKTRADKFRNDLLAKGMHPTGKCGFVFRLPDHLSLKPGDIVRARVAGDIQDLGNSPRTFRDEVESPAKPDSAIQDGQGNNL